MDVDLAINIIVGMLCIACGFFIGRSVSDFYWKDKFKEKEEELRIMTISRNIGMRDRC